MSTITRFARSALLCLVIAFSVFTPASPVSAATDKLPDLGMARLQDIDIVKTADGRRLLRFTTIIVNMGAGAFEIHGQRPDSSTQTMSVTQRIYDSAGGYRDVATNATVLYDVGDGHNHWHVKDLETYDLIRMDNGVKVGTGAKTGFCFYDNRRYVFNLPGEPTSKVYTNCGTSGDLVVVTGLSIGWEDIYPYNVAYQYVDITGLKAGRYRLRVTADNFYQFTESNESNNFTWVDIQLRSKKGTGFKIIAYGPHI